MILELWRPHLQLFFSYYAEEHFTSLQSLILKTSFTFKFVSKLCSLVFLVCFVAGCVIDLWYKYLRYFLRELVVSYLMCDCHDTTQWLSMILFFQSVHKGKFISQFNSSVSTRFATAGFLRRFRDPNQVHRISNRVPRIRENYHRVPKFRQNWVPRIREIQVPTDPYWVTNIFLKKKLATASVFCLWWWNISYDKSDNLSPSRFDSNELH